jgi:hypothetical protein
MMKMSQHSTETIDKALLEATLRLAWYVHAYGAIPDVEMAKLAVAAMGLQNDADTNSLLADARLINNRLLEITAQ